MRILFLSNLHHVNNTPFRTVGISAGPDAPSHQWVRAVEAPNRTGTDLFYDIREESFQDICARFPGGNPDVAVVWEPGWQPLPRGLERAPFPVVACVSDWHILMPRMANVLPAFDYLFTDRAGVQALHRMGYPDAEYWPMWGHDPNHSRMQEGVPKQWDIVVPAHLDPNMWRERSRWLVRVAQLGRCYQVMLCEGVYGADYHRLLNASKICFNHSVRQEMNMRCYEAAACGALLFCEDENLEIRDFFEDRIHCVLYNNSNLEELLAYYLERDDERECIVRAARERVASLSFPANLQRLVARLETLDLRDRVERRQREVVITGKAHARQIATVGHPGCAQTALTQLATHLMAHPDDDSALHDFGVIQFMLTFRYQPLAAPDVEPPAWIDHLRRAVELRPRCVLYQMSLALGCIYLNLEDEACAVLRGALALLSTQQDDMGDPLCVLLPVNFGEFQVHYAAWFNANQPDLAAGSETYRTLLAYRCAVLLGRLAECRKQTDEAINAFSTAVAARPDLGSGTASLARLLLAGNQNDQAVQLLEQALSTDPFRLDAWIFYPQALQKVGRVEEARAYVEDRLTILESVMATGEHAVQVATCQRHLRQLLQALPAGSAASKVPGA